MSGVAEGVAGLTLSACFDIVVAGKNFSEDFEQLCILFPLQRARFGLWGESVGLIPSSYDGRRVRYNKNLDRPDIRSGIERTLHNIKSLLDAAGRVDDKYGSTQGFSITPSRGLNVFRNSYERFKNNITRHQKKTSPWKVTRWAIHDAKKFELLIARLKEFVDGLESITKSLGLLEEEGARLRQEIENISDTESLRLLRDASSRHGSSNRDVSVTASRRLITVAESSSERSTFESVSGHVGSAESFVTARSEFSSEIYASDIVSPRSSTSTLPVPTPRETIHRPLSFAAGDFDYGKALSTVKAEDEAHWKQKSINYLAQASSGSSAAKRMFIELRDIEEGKVPFVSATPVGDNLTKILASIEGPPETPYEGGIFWLTVSLPEHNPRTPILLRFHTKIYHPNISPRGDLCGDYSEKWTPVLAGLGAERISAKDNPGLWHQRNKNNQEWTLGALLTAICGLLASPVVDDPLVPEIAQNYLEDYDGYIENAKLYTERFAKAERPPDDQLDFPDESEHSRVSARGQQSRISSDTAPPIHTLSLWSRSIVEISCAQRWQDYTQWDARKFLDAARDQVVAEYGFTNRVYDLELAFAICDKARRFQEFKGHIQSAYRESSRWFSSARQRCKEYIIESLKSVQIQVSRHEDGQLLSIQIRQTQKLYSWTLVRTAEEVEDIFLEFCGPIQSRDISSGIQILFEWCSNRTHLASSCFVYIRLLEHILNSISSHAPHVLGKPKVLAFFYPQVGLDSKDIRFRDYQIEENDVLHVPISHLHCTTIHFADFNALLPWDVSFGTNVILRTSSNALKGTALLKTVDQLGRAGLKFCFLREGEQDTTSTDNMEVEFESLKDISVEDLETGDWILTFWYESRDTLEWHWIEFSLASEDIARTWEVTLQLLKIILPAQHLCQDYYFR